MNDLAPALLVLSRVMAGFALAFAVPLAWGWQTDAPALRLVWLQGALVTAGAAALLWTATRRLRRELLPRDGFLLVNLVWLVLPACAAVPPCRCATRCRA